MSVLMIGGAHVDDPCVALALGVIARAMETREGQRWLRSTNAEPWFELARLSREAVLATMKEAA